MVKYLPSEQLRNISINILSIISIIVQYNQIIKRLGIKYFYAEKSSKKSKKCLQTGLSK